MKEESGVAIAVEANARQVGGVHYQGQSTSGRQHWDIVSEFGLDYFQGQITKYVMRWRLKNGIQDLEKARHFLDKYIEVERSRMGGKKLTGSLQEAAREAWNQAAGASPAYVNQDPPAQPYRRPRQDGL